MIRKSFYNILLCAGFAITVVMSACSEDSLTPIDELGDTIYDPEHTEESAIDVQINAFYEKYGSKILYNFNASDLTFGWSSSKNYWYAPIQAENRHYVSDAVSFLKDRAYTQYPTDFVKRFLPYRIFLVDLICTSSDYQESQLVDVCELRTHAFAISNVGEKMGTWTETDWEALQSKLTDFMMATIYSSYSNSNTVVEFGSLIDYPVYYAPLEEDPSGFFPDVEYSRYANGFISGEYNEDWEIWLFPNSTKNDLGPFISFIFSTTKTKMEHILTHPSLTVVSKRIHLVADFIKNDLKLDPVALQNTVCPNDPYPADIFKK